MKAYVVEKVGGPEALELRDVDSVQPGNDEVLIRVKAFGLNRAEAYLRAGHMGEITAPRTPGIEAVGEIINDPAGIFQPGQRVATSMGGMQFSRAGSYAEQVTVLRSNVVDLGNSNLSWEELASLPQAYLTVWGALTKSLKIQKGQTILIRGATSSVGLAAVAYAKAHGLNVIATTRSAERESRLRELGATQVIIDQGEISEQVRALYPAGVDVALEVVGAATLKDTIKAIRPFGAVTVIGLLGGAPVIEHLHLMQDLPSAVSVNFFPSGLFGTAALPLTDTPLAWIAKEIEEGRMPSIVTQVFNFTNLRRAHSLIESNQAFGKFVVLI